MKKTFCFDLDNVICNTKSNNYKNATPNKEAIKLVNKLYSNNFKLLFLLLGLWVELITIKRKQFL